jgi:fructokinase
MSEKQIYGAIEAGGTSFVCAVGTGPEDLITKEITTTTPNETVSKVIEFFTSQTEKVSAIGVACFGPVDLNVNSPTYGQILSSPKLDWNGVNLVEKIQQALKVPVKIDTDVNGAAIGEYRHGAAQGKNNLVYVTVGTGIGGGVLVNGKSLPGLLHTELGHMFVPHDINQDSFGGNCPYHADCLEGLASAGAITERWGTKKASDLPDDHQAWELEGLYLAYAMVNIILTLSPEIIIIGGGVLKRKPLLKIIHKNVKKLLNGYLPLEAVSEDIESYIILPQYHGPAGVLGALELAKQT